MNTDYLELLAPFVRLECWSYLSVQDLGRLSSSSVSHYRELLDDYLWRRLYPSTFAEVTSGYLSRGIEMGGFQINRPYRRECIGWSVSVLQLSSCLSSPASSWLTGTVVDYRNGLFLVRYDLDNREVWEKETIGVGQWHTHGKPRIRFLCAPKKGESVFGPIESSLPQPLPQLSSRPVRKRKDRSLSLDSVDTAPSLSGEVVTRSSMLSGSSLLSPACVDQSGCSSSQSGRHLWRCENFRDRTRAPTRLVAKLTDHTDEVLSISFSNDKQKLASCSRDGTTRVYRVVVGLKGETSFQPLLLISNGAAKQVPCRVLWSPNDAKLLICTESQNGLTFDYDATITCVDAITGKALFSKSNIPFDVCACWVPGTSVFVHGESLSRSPRGNYHQTLAFHDSETDQTVGRFHFRFSQEEAFIHLIQVSPDGNLLAVSCGLGSTLSDVVRVVRIPETFEKNFEIAVPKPKFDQKLIVERAMTSFTSIAQGDPLMHVSSLLPSLPKSKLVSIADPLSDGSCVVPSFFCGGAVLGLAWSRDSSKFYANVRPYVKARRLDEVTDRPDLSNTFHVQVWSLTFDGNDNEGGLLNRLDNHQCPSLISSMAGAHGFTTKDCPFYLFIAESPCGEYLASGSEDCGVYVYHVRHGRLLRVLKGHADVVSMVAWCGMDNSSLLATASDDHSVCVWA